jgi:hypothetical protein
MVRIRKVRRRASVDTECRARTDPADAFFRQAYGTMRKICQMELEGNESEAMNHRRLVQLLFAQLARRRDFVGHAAIWSDLYAHSTFFYPLLTHIAGIPFVNVIKHNHIGPAYLRWNVPNHVPLLHFDGHEDLNHLPHYISRKVYMIGQSYRRSQSPSTRRRLLTQLHEAVTDIGASMSGVLIAGGARPLAWLMPRWVRMTADRRRFAIARWTGTGALGLSSPDIWNGRKKSELPSTMPIAAQNPVCLQHVKRLPRYTPSAPFARLSGEGSPQPLLDFLASCKGDRFLLDIDLDYFVSNGIPKSAGPRDGDDCASPMRRPLQDITDSPRDMFAQGQLLRAGARREIALVDARIRRFMGLLRQLRKSGWRPIGISVSDSTFAYGTPHVSPGNNYVPQHYALYVRERLVSALERFLWHN